ncbi:hypothetical protein E9993_19775 [Labilibacter sediminis]|nr:hypothetical protein E9993_19775 [Labilibacter sediminis]
MIIIKEEKMKKFNVFTVVIASVLFFGCDLNELPEFNDKDAFVAFEEAKYSFREDAGVLKIPVMLPSANGVVAKVEYEIKDATAIEGEHFMIVGERTLNFTNENSTDTIFILAIDNERRAVDMSLVLELKDAGAIPLGNQAECYINIEDDEHPLANFVGTWECKGESYDDGAAQWNMYFTKDEKEENKLWIENLVLYGSNLPVYGIVNEDMTQIVVPVKQHIGKAPDDKSIAVILLEGYYGQSGNDIPEGGVITIDVIDDDQMEVMDWMESVAYGDPGGQNAYGYYNLFYPNVMLTKK